mmetsp:Transcript_13843/g.38258  ORF Transcript_13843/g.38258 Transcript_13843/m.38258 type:complete len:434 (-) Transcript_13843:166-1467(-)
MISRASLLLKRHCRVPRPSYAVAGANCEWMVRVSPFSTSGGSDGDGSGRDGKDSKPALGVDNDDEDVFGVNYEDGDDKLGPSSMLPPKFKRDVTTGRQTDTVEKEISAKDNAMLKKAQNANDADLYLQEQVNKHWDRLDGYVEGEDERQEESDRKTHWAAEMGRHVRQADMGLNVLGRSVKSQVTSEVNRDDGKHIQKDEHGFSQRLTQDEFSSFQDYMKTRHNVDISEEDMPVMEHQREPENQTSDSLGNIGDWKQRMQNQSPDDPELSNKWMTALAQRQMEDAKLEDNPYADLMPSDLSISRLVNRKKARRIPRELLHQNNIPLLQSFLSPTGQIQHRIHTRLGARDQRKVSKLVRRARAMGLIPYQGQFTSEQHGWIHAPDLHETRDWEKELEDRGLKIQPKLTGDDDDEEEAANPKVSSQATGGAKQQA